MNREKKMSDEREINLTDLLIEILMHWRGLVIAMLIGGIVFGGYSYYSSYKAYKTAVAAKTEAETREKEEEGPHEEKNVSTIEEIEKNLTESQKVNIDRMLFYKEQLIRYEKLIDNALIMQINPEKTAEADITIKINASEELIPDIERAYEDILTSGEMSQYVAEKIDISDNINGCIGLERSAYGTNATVGILTFYIYAKDVYQATKMADSFIEYINLKVADNQSTLGSHSCTVLDKAVSTIYSDVVLERQDSYNSTVLSLKEAIAAGVDGFSDDEKLYYTHKSTEILKKVDKENPVDSKEEEAIVIPSVVFSKKKLVFGMVIAILVYIAIIATVYIFNGKIKESDDFENLYGIRSLGKVYGAGNKKANKKGLDGAIYSLRRRGRKVISQGDAEKVIAINSAAVVTKEEANNVAIIAGDFDSTSLVEKIKELIIAQNKNVEILENVLYNSADTEELRNIDAAIIIVRPMKSRYNETAEIINLLDGRGIKILGGIVG